MERQKPETPIDLNEKLLSLIQSKIKGVEGLDPLIEDVTREIMEKGGVEPEVREKFRVKKGGE